MENRPRVASSSLNRHPGMPSVPGDRFCGLASTLGCDCPSLPWNAQEMRAPHPPIHKIPGPEPPSLHGPPASSPSPGPPAPRALSGRHQRGAQAWLLLRPWDSCSVTSFSGQTHSVSWVSSPLCSCARSLMTPAPAFGLPRCFGISLLSSGLHRSSLTPSPKSGASRI